MRIDQVNAHLKAGQQLQNQLNNLQTTFNLFKKGGNTAIGIIDNIELPFYADSKLNNPDDYATFSGLNSVVFPCWNFFGDITLPMRLNPELNFYHPSNPGFTYGKEKCAERKIINEMIRHLKKTGNRDKELTIKIYSEMEPCIYCLSAIRVQLAMLHPKLQVIIYFKQQLDDMLENPDNFLLEYKIK